MRSKWFLIALGLAIALLLILFFIRSPRAGNSAVDEGQTPRPDVVEWIEKYFGQDHRKKVALTRLAEIDQYILTHEDAGGETNKMVSLAMSCYLIAFGSDGKDRVDGMPAYEALEAQSFNTFARARKWIAYNGRLSGKSLEDFEVKSWEAECEKPFSP